MVPPNRLPIGKPGIRFGGAVLADPADIGLEPFVARGVASRVVDGLAVVNAIFRSVREDEFAEALLREALDADLERPHHFPVAHDDDTLVTALTVKRVEDAVDAQAEHHERFTVRRTPEERFDLPHLERLAEAFVTFVLGGDVDIAPITLGQVRVGEPLGTAQVEQASCFLGPDVLRGVAPVEARTATQGGFDPVTGLGGLFTAEVGESVASRVAPAKLFRVGRVVTGFGKTLGSVAFRLSMADQDEIEGEGHDKGLLMYSCGALTKAVK